MTPQPRDENALRQETVAWYARLCSGEATEADQQAWQQWHQQHPDHQRAWQRIAAFRTAVQRVPSRIALPTLLAAGQSRRHALRGMAVLAGTGLLGYASYRTLAEGKDIWLADYRTGVGEQRSVALADGSRMLLNTDSAADVLFSSSQRVVRLWAGEVLVETASHRAQGDAASNHRPFTVATRHGSVRALGTRFSVRQQAAQTTVAVLADAVDIYPQELSGRPQRMHAGQQASFDSQRTTAPQAVDDSVAAWEYGSIVASDWRLGDLLAELARYRPGHLACDPAAASLRVSGAFPIADTDKALRVIAKSLPVRVSQRTRYWVRVEAL
ncbi:FecR family protein [Rhodoferax sp. OV413]|uniref:FecR domain-containing protein n=1 Tax=Rhodoferax sp. OV413 TaxID=1855285 RepID=UPI000890F968|nr:FecR domain-containing protein [Rhodoferax sp. OV413]SDN94192.1 FecR family protein [Rhodoferax sp. OV413]